MSPEIQEWSHKSRLSRINNLYLLTRPIVWLIATYICLTKVIDFLCCNAGIHEMSREEGEVLRSRAYRTERCKTGKCMYVRSVIACHSMLLNIIQKFGSVLVKFEIFVLA